ncbi:MAG TPA: VWA domain-containing protein [Pyrinomonadaceae bacterium]|jgi:VWFA-related protein|nr:VWA domain-containing protein [Pyrinomonadaceae bacterium]
MFYQKFFAACGAGGKIHISKAVFILGLLAVLAAASTASAQSYTKELETPEKISLTVKSHSGRVSVIAQDELLKKIIIEASSTGALVDATDIHAVTKGNDVGIEVRDRRDNDRIDLVVRVPSRSKVKVEGEAGSVDVVGNVESAEVSTNTGTIHADVPLDAVKFDFMWSASKPRYLSDVELPKIKERAAGVFTISGKLGEKKPAKEERVQLNFLTQRGVVLLNVDPSMVPSDLHERPLTEAARAIVRSGDSQLVDAIRKVSPKMFGDFAKTLPPPEKEPTLVRRAAPGQFISASSPQFLRFNASVTDRNGRAIGGMKESDFTVYENGVERQVTKVVPTKEPFNLVLLLDVSGSVEERIEFIRKAARDFLNTASPQDRIAIISFRDDIQIISDFTTNRRLLSRKLDEIDAGGGTALYDALGYVFANTLKQLRGERTAIVILSDGDDNKSFVPFPAILEAITESGALIYPLYIPSGLVPERSVPKPDVTIDPLRTRYLTLTTRAHEEGQKLAQASGGVYYPIRHLEELQRAYDDVVVQLRTAYTITYASNLSPAGNPRVRVRANREGASVRLSPVVNVATP